MKIYKQITAVMNDLEAITKNRKNQSQGWTFRGIDDVYNAMHPLLAKHGVFTVPEVLEERTEEKTTRNGGLSIYRILKIKYHFFAEDGSNVAATVIGEGMDPGDKASNKAMAVAHKYALMQVFAIPTEEAKDPDFDHHDLVPRPTTYQGTEVQKGVLFSLFKSVNVTDPAFMGVIATKLIGVPMGDLKSTIQTILDSET